MMKKIGIFGGTFNPIHNGHLIMAERFREEFKLSEIIFVPTFLPPHKDSHNLASVKDRLTMLDLSVKANKYFSVSDFEAKKENKSYSIVTVRHLKGKYPDGTQFFFLMGSDNVQYLHTWREIEKLKALVNFVVVKRFNFEECGSNVAVEWMSSVGVDISSTEIRHRVKISKTIQYLLPQGVEEFIDNNKIYR